MSSFCTCHEIASEILLKPSKCMHSAMLEPSVLSKQPQPFPQSKRKQKEITLSFAFLRGEMKTSWPSFPTSIHRGGCSTVTFHSQVGRQLREKTFSQRGASTQLCQAPGACASTCCSTSPKATSPCQPQDTLTLL